MLGTKNAYDLIDHIGNKMPTPSSKQFWQTNRIINRIINWNYNTEALTQTIDFIM